MAQPLRLLHLEDDPDYSTMLSTKLAAEEIEAEVVCVATRKEFEAALAQGGFDLIIADYSLPDYNGILAMQLAQEKQPHAPLLLVSGTIGEEAAIECLKAGATDYVLKLWPERLVPAWCGVGRCASPRSEKNRLSWRRRNWCGARSFSRRCRRTRWTW